MVIIVRRLILLLILFILPFNVFAITREEYNEAVANVSISAATTYADDFAYSFYWGGNPSNPENKSYLLTEYMNNAFKGIKTKSGYIYGTKKSDAGIHGSFANKFPVYCLTFVKEMVYHASNGKASFNYGSKDSYEKIKISDLKRGDIIDFDSHIAIYLGDGFDNNPNTFYVAEASGKLHVRTIERYDLETGWRIKDSALLELDENIIKSSYDFHDRLDDYPPIINSVNEIENANKIKIKAIDYKHYELKEKSDILEPESNGIVAYKVSNSLASISNNWITVNKTNNLDIEVEVNSNGTYYVYVKDVGGNVTFKTINVTKVYIDKEKPNLGEFSYEKKNNSIEITITGANDNIGIKEYRYYLNNKLVTSTKDNIYEINNLSNDREYDFYYEVVDVNDNVSKSEIYQVDIKIEKIEPDPVIQYDLKFINKELLDGYLNKEYNQNIYCNYPAKVSLVDGELPKGIYLNNNTLVGIPSKSGEYYFTLKAEYMNSVIERNFVINIISEHNIYDYILYLSVVILVILLIYIIYKYKKEFKKRR